MVKLFIIGCLSNLQLTRIGIINVLNLGRQPYPTSHFRVTHPLLQENFLIDLLIMKKMLSHSMFLLAANNQGNKAFL